jgi:hypothetical protein
MSEERIDLIERYLAGKMSAEEEAKFVTALDTDNELRQEYNRIRLIHDALELGIENDLRKELKDLERISSSRKPAPVRRMRLWAVAASLFVLVVAGTVIIRQNSSTSIDTFTSEQYVEYNYGQTRSSDQSTSPLRQGIDLIDNGALGEASQWIENYIASNPNDTEAKFILADVKKDLGEINASKELLEVVIESGSVLWSEKAEWNYVVISAFDHWDDTAEDLLTKISSDSAHSYNPAARQLKELRNGK